MISDLYLSEAVKKNTVRWHFGHPHARLSVFLSVQKASPSVLVHAQTVSADGQALILVAISKERRDSQNIIKLLLPITFI